MSSPTARSRVGAIALDVVTWVVALVIFFPILWIFLQALKTEADAYHAPPLFIFRPVLTNLANALGGGDYLHYLRNSTIVSIGSVAIADALGLPIAFYLAELKWKGKGDGLFAWILSTRFMPVVGVIVPMYVIFNTIGLLDSLGGLLLVYTAISLPLVIVIMRSFYLELPYSIIEASVLEGGGFGVIFMRIINPMAISGIVTASILAVIFNWNEYFLAVSLSGARAGTLAVYIASFITSEGLYWARLSGIAVLAILPILILGWLAQRNIVQGLTLGAIKG